MLFCSRKIFHRLYFSLLGLFFFEYSPCIYKFASMLCETYVKYGIQSKKLMMSYAALNAAAADKVT